METKSLPHSLEVEQLIIASLIQYTSAKDELAYLKPSHFFFEKHQIIFEAIQQLDVCNLPSLHQYLKKTKQLEKVGGINYLLTINGLFLNQARVEYFGRILQQFYIKREIIRVSNEAMKESFDPSTDCFEVLDDYTTNMEGIQSLFDPQTLATNFISDLDNEMQFFKDALKGEQKTGLSTGFEHLDRHFRFKPNSFVIINGHDNVGKTYIMLYLCVISNLMHQWRWILCCLENQEGRVRQDLIQFKTGKHISQLTKEEFEHHYKWATDNFTILKITNEISADKLLKLASKLCKSSTYNAFFIDPYNALDVNIKDKWMSSHEYHYQVTNRMRNFIKNHNCCIYLSTHAVTEALRKLHTNGNYNGFPMPPQKADVEGGGKFSNRADDFITIHRYSQHTTDFNQTHIHIRKIKDTQTGGRPTTIDDPVRLQVKKGYFGFFDMDGYSPILSLTKK